MRSILVELETANTKIIEPCQLKKVSNRRCCLACAFENKCPVYYANEHEQPLILKKDNYI